MVKTISKENSIVAYKAFDANFKCRDFQYAPGMSYHIDGEVKLCENGFHACQDLMDTFSYYPMRNSRFAIVKLWGDVFYGNNKMCASNIEIVKELSLKDIVERYATSKVKFLEHKNCTRFELNKSENELCNKGYGNYIISTNDYKRIVSRGSGNHIVTTGISNTIFSIGDAININCIGSSTHLVSIGSSSHISLDHNFTAALYGNNNKITLSYNHGSIISNGNDCFITIISNYVHCETNGENNKINVIGNSTIDSKGINDELILNGDDIRFRAKYGSTITCIGKEKMIVGESELKADTWYTYNFGTIEYNDIFNQREKNKSK